MQLNDILEENSIRVMSDKTKISEENLEYLLASDFDGLSRIKTLGFISILEREYKADLSELREAAMEYYGQSREAHLFPIGQLVMNEHRGKSKLLIIFIFLLLGVSSWYFFTQFDKKHLNNLIPFVGEKTIERFIGSDDKAIKKENVAEDLSIGKAIGNILKTDENATEKDVVISTTENTDINEDNKSNVVEVRP